MMIRKNDFFPLFNKTEARKTCERHALDGESEKKEFEHLPFVLIFA
jgi:hypothetical protein